MKKILMILACCMILLATPIAVYATEQAERLATDSNATSEEVKIQEIELSIICTKPNENIKPENIQVDFKTQHCHIKVINITRYNKAEIVIVPDNGYRFSKTIEEWANISGSGVSIIDSIWTFARENEIRITVQNTATTEPNENDSFQNIFDKYTDRVESEVQKIKEEGIKMSEANTEDSVREYANNKITKPFDENIEYDILIESGRPGSEGLMPAEAGTSSNPKGKDGSCSITVRIWEKGDKETLKKISYTVKIKPSEYISPSVGSNGSGGGSSSGGGGGSSSSGGRRSSINIDSGLSVTKVNIIMGTWEQMDGKWKLKVSDGSYASSQWAFLDGKWYILGSDGYMLNDWQMVNGKWYFFGADGAMQTGWQLINSKWYWLNESGEMMTGWGFISDKWYYLGEDGAMLSGMTTPDGYTVNENGEWIQ